ncbi:MAG TPA: c-type cytochrome, partial [Vicinamibacterales bacterium]|nr:c-type cytochrome [Vicinamibacterales bacterium]
GLSHANMRAIAFAQEQEDFDAWVENEQQEAREPGQQLAAEGARLFVEGSGDGTFPNGGACGSCHTIEGTTAQGIVGPNLTHFASRETFAGAMFELNEANLAAWIDDPPAVKPGSLMPDYNLSPEEIDAVVAYLMGLE